MIQELLTAIKKEYAENTTAPVWISDTITPADINAIRDESSIPATTEQSFMKQTTEIRRTLWDKWLQKEATIQSYTCKEGRVLVVSIEPIQPPQSWIRIFRLLNPGKVAQVIWFASDEERIAPAEGAPIEAIHINGGYAQKCNPRSIVLYRKEEATRVLIHELLHASCSDPGGSLPYIESDTEAWAEIVLIGLKAKGVQRAFTPLWKDHAYYATKQAVSAKQFHNVQSEADYSYRYLVGRLATFKRLGLPLPKIETISRQVKSLRLTDKKLELIDAK